MDVNSEISTDPGEGCTPLIWAVKHKNLPMVKILLELGADPHLKGKKDLYTARTVATQCKLTDVRNLLLSADKLKKDGPSGKKKNVKRKREKGEKQEEEAEEEKTREKKKQKTKQPAKISEAKLSEKKMEEIIREKLKWICDRDTQAQVYEVFAAKGKNFSVFSLKMACRKYKLQPSSQKSESVGSCDWVSGGSRSKGSIRIVIVQGNKRINFTRFPIWYFNDRRRQINQEW